MLTNELMGVVALAILWLNVALVSADALLRARDLRRFAARAARGLLVGTASETLARFVVEQTGRHGSADQGEKKTILFHDRGSRSEVAGGRVEVGDRSLVLPTQQKAEVWVARAALEEAGRCASPAAFDAAYVEARKAKGLHREIVVPVATGAKVWLVGRVGEVALEPLDDDGVLLSTVEPLAWLRAARWRLHAFVAALFVASVGCTALALSPPVFGLASTLGGAACLALFLLAQPAGTAVRDACKRPSEQPLRGAWVRSPAGPRRTETPSVS